MSFRFFRKRPVNLASANSLESRLAAREALKKKLKAVNPTMTSTNTKISFWGRLFGRKQQVNHSNHAGESVEVFQKSEFSAAGVRKELKNVSRADKIEANWRKTGEMVRKQALGKIPPTPPKQ